MRKRIFGQICLVFLAMALLGTVPLGTASAGYSMERASSILIDASVNQKFYNIYALDGGDFAVISLSSDRGADPILWRYDKNGTLRWKTNINPFASFAFKSVAESVSGEVAVISLAKGDYSYDHFNSVVSEYDASGKLAWSKNMTSSRVTYSFRAIIAASDGYILAGCKKDEDGIAHSVLMKIDYGGKTLWEHVGDDGTGYHSVAVLTDGRIYAGGCDNYDGDGDSGEKTNAILDVYSKDGKSLSNKKLSTGGWSAVWDVRTLQNGDVEVLVSGEEWQSRLIVVAPNDDSSFSYSYTIDGVGSSNGLTGLLNDPIIVRDDSIIGYSEDGAKKFSIEPSANGKFISATVSTDGRILAVENNSSPASSSVVFFNSVYLANIEYKIVSDRNPVDSQSKSMGRTVRVSDSLTLPSTSDDDYAFDGWYLDSSLTQKASEDAVRSYFGITDSSISAKNENMTLTLYGRWIYKSQISLPVVFAIIGGATVLIAVASAIVAIKIKKNRKNKQVITKDDPKQTNAVVKDSEQTVTEVNIVQTDADEDHDSAKE